MLGALVLGVIGAFVGLYHKGYSNGKSDSDNAHKEAFDKANNEYREKERKHEATINELRARFVKEDSKENGADRVVAGNLSTGVKRMFTRAKCPPTSKVSAPTSGNNGAAVAELEAEVAARLYTIAADGDRAIRKLIALQEWAKEAVKLCNGEVK